MKNLIKNNKFRLKNILLADKVQDQRGLNAVIKQEIQFVLESYFVLSGGVFVFFSVDDCNMLEIKICAKAIRGKGIDGVREGILRDVDKYNIV